MKIKFIEDLKQYRKENGLTYAQLGVLIGTTPDVTFDMLNGRRRFVDFTVIQNILRLLPQKEV